MAAAARIDELKKRYEENQRRFFAPLANEYRKAGDLELAIALCRQHLADAPSNLSGQIVFGQALFDAGTFDESRTAFETAIGLDPENLIALRHLGDIARGQNDFGRAREWYQRVLDADRRNDDVLAIMREMNEASAAPTASPADDPGSFGNQVLEAPPPAAPEAAPAQSWASQPWSSQPWPSETAPAVEPPLTPAETPTIPIPAMRRPEPLAPEPAPELAAESAAEVPLSEPSSTESESLYEAQQTPFGFDIDLTGAGALPTVEPESRDSFSFAQDAVTDDEPLAVDQEPVQGLAGLSYTADEFATAIPTHVPDFNIAPSAPAEYIADETYADAAYADDADSSSFGIVEVPDDSPFGAASDAAPLDAPLDDGLSYDDPGVPSALVEDGQSVPSAGAFELLESASQPEEVLAHPQIDDFFGATPSADPEPAETELEDWAMPEPVAPLVEPPADPEPSAAVEEPVSSFAAFDPVRQMPTPVAPVDATELASAPAPAEAFATETMAELYARQGMKSEAIAVYRQLLATRPDDAGLQGRLAALETEPSPSLWSSARSFFAGLSNRRATPTRIQAMPAVAPEPVAPEAPPEMTAAAPVEAPFEAPLEAQPEALMEVEPAVASPVQDFAPAPPVDAGFDYPTAEAFEFGEPLAPVAEVVGSGYEAYDAPPVEPAPAEMALELVEEWSEPEPDPIVDLPEPTPEPVVTSPIEELFANAPIAATDDQAAGTLADAFGGPPPTLAGKPARTASDDVSLDKVFRKPAATPPGGLTSPRQSSSLRFDQFFGQTDPAASSPDMPQLDPGTDGEQFQSWLTGLKKP